MQYQNVLTIVIHKHLCMFMYFYIVIKNDYSFRAFKKMVAECDLHCPNLRPLPPCVNAFIFSVNTTKLDVK